MKPDPTVVNAQLPDGIDQASFGNGVRVSYTAFKAADVNSPPCFSLATGKSYPNPGLTVLCTYIAPNLDDAKASMLIDLKNAGYNSVTKTFS